MHARLGRRHEQGVASILMVVFFILIASIITIGFMRLSLLENRQSLEDSLSKSALAAAYSGVNDAKRALLHCLNLTTAQCDQDSLTGINNQNCPGFFGNQQLREAIGIDSQYNAADGSVYIGSPGDSVNERYTCVIVTNDTSDVIGPLTVDDSSANTTIIPLRSKSDYNSIRLSWQRRVTVPNLGGLSYGATAGDELRATFRDSDAYGNYYKWNNQWPALMRMTLYAYPKTGIVYNPDGTTNIKSKTSFLYPRNVATQQVVGMESLTRRQLTNCRSAGYTTSVNTDRYLCQITLSNLTAANPDFDPIANELYLQLTNMYVDTDYSVEMFNGNIPVKFNDVSPSVDSTGAVDATFRRVQIRLRYHGSTPILPNAIDTGSGICKDFVIGTVPSVFRETCGY